MRKVLIACTAVGCFLSAVYLCFVFSVSQYESSQWITLARMNTSDGGYCFVRQLPSSILFSDVGFGYVSRSGTTYSYPLENDGVHRHRVRLLEKDGVIHVWRGAWPVAAFVPAAGILRTC